MLLIPWLIGQLITAAQVAFPITTLLWIRHKMREIKTEHAAQHFQQQSARKPTEQQPARQQDMRQSSFFPPALVPDQPEDSTYTRSDGGRVYASEFSKSIVHQGIYLTDGYELYDHEVYLSDRQVAPCPLLVRQHCDDCDLYMNNPRTEYATRCAGKSWIEELGRKQGAEGINVGLEEFMAFNVGR